MDIYPLVYHCAVVIKPQQPFLDWINKIGPPSNVSLTELQNDAHLYLVPDYEEEDVIEKAIAKYLKLNYSHIFFHELSGWNTDETTYPKLTYALFLEWFSISTHTMIFDTLNEPIEKED
jgi:hypothetical protein